MLIERIARLYGLEVTIDGAAPAVPMAGTAAKPAAKVIGGEVDSAPNDSQQHPTAPYDLKYTLLLAPNDSH